MAHAGPNLTQLPGGIPSRAADPDQLLRRLTGAMFEIVEDASYHIARQTHKRVPSLGSVNDEEAFEATRKSDLGSMYELLCIIRAGLTSPEVIETSPEALEHLAYLREHGVGMKSVLGFYYTGFAMFEPLMAHELGRFVNDPATIQQMAGPMRHLVYTYVDQITKRLAAEYGSEREGWVPDPNDPVWHDPDSVEAAHRMIAEIANKERLQPGESGAARAFAGRALDRFCSAMEAAAEDPRLSSVLARAKTTVRIELADDPELFVTLLLDRDPIELTQEDVQAEVEVSIVSVDLARLYSPDFHLSMAITRGRVGYTGPVRKFLRVSPVVRHASLPQLLKTDTVHTWG